MPQASEKWLLVDGDRHPKYEHINRSKPPTTEKLSENYG